MSQINPSLQEERSNISFNLNELGAFYYGSVEERDYIVKKLNILSEDPILRNDPSENDLDRSQLFKLYMQKTRRFHELFNFTQPSGQYLSHFGHQLVATLHTYMFIPTIKNLGTEKQVQKWLDPCLKMEIFGCYAQTEMGHGSDVQSLETTATFDKNTDEFILHSPTVTSTKWWPGELGKMANHCVTHAQLYIDGKHYGLHTFFVQIRDMETHQSLPGIEVGDVGRKFGYDTKDNGFLRFTNYRIPRENMLMKYSKVNKNGEFTKQGNDKIGYATMMSVRRAISNSCSEYLSLAVTISTRYSIVRNQFKDDDGKELRVFDYQTQMDKILPLIAMTYAMKCGAQKLGLMDSENIKKINEKQDFSMMNDLHGSLSGTKAFWTWDCLQGIEISKLACGGFGFLKNAGFAQLYTEWSPNCTHEGENTVMALQCARYLIKCLSLLKKGKPLAENVNYLTFLNEILSVQQCPAKSIEDFDLKILYKCVKANACYLIYSAAQKISTSIKEGLSLKETWNTRAGLELVEAARAHITCFTFRSFMERIELYNISCPKTKDLLTKLCQLYALHKLLQFPLGLIESNYISPNQIKLMRLRKEALLSELRPSAVGLVDALQLPDNTLKSALGRYDGNVYDTLLDLARNKNIMNKTDVVDGWKEYISTLKDIPRITPKL